MGFLKTLNQYRNSCDINTFSFICKNLYYKLRKKNILLHNNTLVKGINNIIVNGKLIIGLNCIGFLNKYDRTFLNIRGKLIINGKVNIEKGCRIDVGPNAVCILNNCSINGNTKLIIEHGLEIGENSIISWECEILDEDWHKLIISGKEKNINDKTIKIGNHVWIGSYSKIYRGVKIGNNSVVIANSMVIRSFPPDVLIGGIPANILMRNTNWE